MTLDTLHRQSKAILARFRRRMALATAYQRIWDDPDGRLVLEDILRKSGLLETSQVDGAPDATSYREGRRALGLDVVQMLRWSEGELVAQARQQTSDQLEEGE